MAQIRRICSLKMLRLYEQITPLAIISLTRSAQGVDRVQSLGPKLLAGRVQSFITKSWTWEHQDVSGINTIYGQV